MCNHHNRTQRCPLYLASHIGNGTGCIGGTYDTPCKVNNGDLDYWGAVVAAIQSANQRDKMDLISLVLSHPITE